VEGAVCQINSTVASTNPSLYPRNRHTTAHMPPHRTAHNQPQPLEVYSTLSATSRGFLASHRVTAAWSTLSGLASRRARTTGQLGEMLQCDMARLIQLMCSNQGRKLKLATTSITLLTSSFGYTVWSLGRQHHLLQLHLLQKRQWSSCWW
jgi:hypothetical protein